LFFIFKGGNMHNNVVIALQRYFVSKGYLAVCINFRGCGNSKGRTSWTGMPEREDYYGVIDFITKDDNEHMKDYPKVSSILLCVSLVVLVLIEGWEGRCVHVEDDIVKY
jgi:hypothetical protein